MRSFGELGVKKEEELEQHGELKSRSSVYLARSSTFFSHVGLPRRIGHVREYILALLWGLRNGRAKERGGGETMEGG